MPQRLDEGYEEVDGQQGQASRAGVAQHQGLDAGGEQAHAGQDEVAERYQAGLTQRQAAQAGPPVQGTGPQQVAGAQVRPVVVVGDGDT